MQCSGIILKIRTDLHLVLILLCQVRPFATRRLVKEYNVRPVRWIYGTGTIGWQNSALDRRKFYDIKFCHVVQTNMNSRYHSNKILTCSMKATWLFKLRLYLQSNFRLCLNQLLYNNHKVTVRLIYHTYAQARSRRWSRWGRSGAKDIIIK